MRDNAPQRVYTGLTNRKPQEPMSPVAYFITQQRMAYLIIFVTAGSIGNRLLLRDTLYRHGIY
ncbi:hypothetical protein [Dickeya zeae]|uniref:Uncharacterized protein n=1 Tax=Dickeya zeae TaxID=204042 RepID=A0ABX8W1C0_9GAMM|nr:hypothetical protein [Dickeya zeae]QYM92270.1 hypothetical protein FGI21_10485 [Dickeya zeae]